MASISIAFTGPQGSLSRTLNLADSDLDRVVDAYKVDNPAATNAQVVTAFAEHFATHLRTFVKSIETREAARNATPVAPIGIS